MSRAITIDTDPRGRANGVRRGGPHAARPARVLDAERARDLSQARNAPADRLVQDPRRVQRRPPPDRRRSSPTASGPSAPATPRRASRSPRARPARRCSVMVMDTAPGGQARQHRAPRRDDRQGDLRRVLADGRDARVGSHARPLRPSVRRRRLHQRQRHGGPRDRRRPAGRRRGRRADRRRRPARRHRRRAARAAAGGEGLRGRAGNRGAARSARSSAGEASRFEDWQASFVDGAGGKSVLDTMWPLLRSTCRRVDRRLARRGGARR